MRVLAIATICIAYLILIVPAVIATGQDVGSRKSIAPVEDVDGRTGDDGKSDRRASQLHAMQKIAEGLTIETVEGKTRLDLIPGARFRFSTPDIGVFDGTAWLWGTGRRPLVLLTISAEQFVKDGPRQWSCELTSLAPVELSTTSPQGWEWKPQKAGLEFQTLPDAPAPAESRARRQRQIKDLSRRFDAYGWYADRKARLELRTLPTPIYTYDDKQAGVRDGAMFFVAGGTNPEALLSIELSGEGAAEPVWKFALNRVSSGELHARFDGKEVWSCEQQRENTTRDAYYILMRPMPPELGKE